MSIEQGRSCMEVPGSADPTMFCKISAKSLFRTVLQWSRLQRAMKQTPAAFSAGFAIGHENTWMCTTNFKTLDTTIMANNRVMGWVWQRQRWASVPFCTARATRRLALRYGRQANICKSPHDRAAFFFPFVVLYKQGDWCRRVVTVMLRAGTATPNCISFLQTRHHPKEKRCSRKLCIYLYMANIRASPRASLNFTL